MNRALLFLAGIALSAALNAAGVTIFGDAIETVVRGLPGAECAEIGGDRITDAEIACARGDGAAGVRAAHRVNNAFRAIGLDPGPSINDLTGGRR